MWGMWTDEGSRGGGKAEKLPSSTKEVFGVAPHAADQSCWPEGKEWAVYIHKHSWLQSLGGEVLCMLFILTNPSGNSPLARADNLWGEGKAGYLLKLWQKSHRKLALNRAKPQEHPLRSTWSNSRAPVGICQQWVWSNLGHSGGKSKSM